MADYVQVMIVMAAQWRVWRAIGPTAAALVGLPLTEARPAPAATESRPVLPVALPMARVRKQRKPKGGSGEGRPKNGHKASS